VRVPTGADCRPESLNDTSRAAWRADDFGVVDALEIDRGDAEVGVSELALDDHDRDALAGHLHGVGVAQLVWREATPDCRSCGGAPKLYADSVLRPWPTAGRAADDAEERPDRQLFADLEPWVELLPAPAVHADLAALAALAAAHQDRPAGTVKVALGERERFADPQP
jgi:hypothetical protein